jgi:hypothetical protein
LSEHTDNPEVEDDEMTRVIEPDASEHDSEDEHWVESESEPAEEWDEPEEEDELPPRPRNRFLRPLPIALVAVLIAAAGFLGGVLVQKGSEGSGSAGGASGLPSFLTEGAGEGSGSEASSGLPAGLGASGGGSAVSGTVSSVDGETIYVKDSEGNVVAVKAEDGSTISRDSNVGVKKIHPGDSVVVQGSKHGSTVKASSISATGAGVETTGLGAGSLPGAEGGEAGGSESGEAGGSESGGSVESLFGE